MIDKLILLTEESGFRDGFVIGLIPVGRLRPLPFAPRCFD